MKTSCPGNLIASTEIFYLKKTTLLSHKSFLSLVNLICLNIISSLEMVVTLGLTMCSYTAHFCFNPDNCFHYLESFLIQKRNSDSILTHYLTLGRWKLICATH